MLNDVESEILLVSMASFSSPLSPLLNEMCITCSFFPWFVQISQLNIVTLPFRISVTKAAFMLILRRQNQRFETLIQNADPKRR